MIGGIVVCAAPEVAALRLTGSDRQAVLVVSVVTAGFDFEWQKTSDADSPLIDREFKGHLYFISVWVFGVIVSLAGVAGLTGIFGSTVSGIWLGTSDANRIWQSHQLLEFAMSVKIASIEIDYPDSDGRPMGESDLHRGWMIHVIDLLQHRFRNEHACVSGDLLLYYVKGRKDCCVAPDAFVVKNHAPGKRRSCTVWEEIKPPSVVFEITSSSTAREDRKK